MAGAVETGGAHDGALVRVCDLAGRPRGTGFLADNRGTLVTSHEAVDGLARLVLHASGEQVCLVEAEAVTALPALGLALVATEGLRLASLPVAPPGPVTAGRRVLLPPALSGVVVRSAVATYAATDRFHLLDAVQALTVDPPVPGPARTASGTAPAPGTAPASGTPVTDAATGAVLGVVVTAVHAGFGADTFAVPLHTGSAPEPLAHLLARNAATVPAYGEHLNLAGALRLTAATGARALTPRAPAPGREPVARRRADEALLAFLAAPGPDAPHALGLVGEPGTGRSTLLAALAAQRARDPHPAPTLRLRGADLRPGDGSIGDAVARALRDAARIVAAADGAPDRRPPVPDDDADTDPAATLAEVAAAAGRPLAVLLDAAEEMPPVLAHDLPGWAARTAAWLRTTGTRMVVACRPELWERLGMLLPADLLAAGRPDMPGAAHRPLPPCLRLGDLRGGEAVVARARHGVPDGALAPADARHPLALRLMAEVRGAFPAGQEPPTGPRPPARGELLAAYLDLMSLRIAEHVAAATSPAVRGTDVRRLAARAAGRIHAAARRCLGPGQGELDREGFEELFPWRTGWAAAVLTEGLLVPAGAGYRFAHEEFGDWIQSLHLDLSAALYALVHRWVPAASGSGPAGEAPVRLPSRAAAQGGRPPAVPPAPALAPAAYPRTLPVPRHRAGAVVRALLAASPHVLAVHLRDLLEALDALDALDPAPAAPAGPHAATSAGHSARQAFPMPGPRRAPGGRVAGPAGEAPSGPTPFGAALGAAGPPSEDGHVPGTTGPGTTSSCGGPSGPAGQGMPGPFHAGTAPTGDGRLRLVGGAHGPGLSGGAADCAGARSAGEDGACSTPGPGTVDRSAGAEPFAAGRGPAATRSGAAAGDRDPVNASPDVAGVLNPASASGVHVTRPAVGGPGTASRAAASGPGLRVPSMAKGAAHRVVAPPGATDPAPGDVGHAADPAHPGTAPGSGTSALSTPSGTPISACPGPTGPTGSIAPAPYARDDAPDGAGAPTTARGAARPARPATVRVPGAPRTAAGGGAASGCGDRPGRPGPARPAGPDRTLVRVDLAGSRVPDPPVVREPAGTARRREDARWWAAHLLREALLGVADARPFQDTLRALAARTAARAGEAHEPETAGRHGGFAAFGPWFWRALPLPVAERLELLRVLLPADEPAGRPARAGEHGGPPGSCGDERYLTAAARLLRSEPAEALPAVCRWLTDDRPLRRAEPGPEGEPCRLTVAGAAQALLYTQRRRNPDALTEALADAAHPAADAVLAALAEEDPAVLCRAVDRWARDDRPERRAAAAAHGLRAAAGAQRDTDRETLRHAALALLSRPGEDSAHAAALGILVRDPVTRVRYLPAALARFAARDPAAAPAALLAALPTHPEMVLNAFRERLRALEEPPGQRLRGLTALNERRPGARHDRYETAAGSPHHGSPSGRRTAVRAEQRESAGPDSEAAVLLTALAAVDDPAHAVRAAALVRDHLARRPESAAAVARYLEVSLERVPAVRAGLLPLAAALPHDHPPAVRAALLPVFGAAGSPASRPLRRELLDTALEAERDPDVLAELLAAAARSSTDQHPLLTRDLVHRVALLLTRTPHGATRFDRVVVDLAGEYPHFARLLRTWVDDAPWDCLLGPSARRGLLSTG